MPEVLCRSCKVELSDNHVGRKCDDCRARQRDSATARQRDSRRRFWAWTGGAAVAVGATVLLAAASRSTEDSEDDDDEQLSPEAHRRIAIYLGEEKADDTAREVREGWTTAAEADEWSKSVEHQWESTKHRPDIEPEDWQAFEEGWRPEGW